MPAFSASCLTLVIMVLTRFRINSATLCSSVLGTLGFLAVAFDAERTERAGALLGFDDNAAAAALVAALVCLLIFQGAGSDGRIASFTSGGLWKSRLQRSLNRPRVEGKSRL